MLTSLLIFTGLLDLAVVPPGKPIGEGEDVYRAQTRALAVQKAARVYLQRAGDGESVGGGVR